jgi:phage host-nuclease inhibitor protein Gam
MARVKKVIQSIAIADWQQADHYLKNIGDLQLEIEDAERTAKADIDQAKLNLSNRVNPLHEQIEVLVRSLEAFSAAHQEDFGDARSRKLDFGVLGWRKSTSISTKKTTLEKIKEVFGRKAAQFLRLKEEVDKDAMAKLTDEQLKAVDARRDVKDAFFVEPSIPVAAEH